MSTKDIEFLKSYGKKYDLKELLVDTFNNTVMYYIGSRLYSISVKDDSIYVSHWQKGSHILGKFYNKSRFLSIKPERFEKIVSKKLLFDEIRTKRKKMKECLKNLNKEYK